MYGSGAANRITRVLASGASIAVTGVEQRLDLGHAVSPSRAGSER